MAQDTGKVIAKKRVKELEEQIIEALNELYELSEDNENAVNGALENIMDHDIMHS